jgi:hypothetical protein
MKSLSKTKKNLLEEEVKKEPTFKKKSSLCAIDDWSMNDFLDFIHIRKKHHPENF